MARPKKYIINKMLPIIKEYTDNTEMPIFKELCVRENWSSKRVYAVAKDNPELSEAIERLINKKEVFLEHALIKGTIKPAGAIFSLKQLGWREEYLSEDQHEQIKLNNKLISINAELQQERLKMIKGDTDLTKVTNFLVEVKNLVNNTKE